MLFNSLSYAIFLPVVFAFYWILKERYRWILLLAASYFFYMCSGPKYGILIGGVTLVSYICARLIEDSESQNRKKVVLAGAVMLCMGILFFFKYFNFFGKMANSLLHLLGVPQDAIMLKIILPVGISFYTFQTMSYVIDVYRGTTKAERHFGKYAAFVSFFPQLVAGPIERSADLLPQIKKEHVFDYKQAMQGVKLMIWGYYKKLLIADALSPYVQTVYGNPREYTGFALVLASAFFALQIYCDFSGYSDIAAGTAKLFGINLMTNFKSPYLSGSLREFWSRWHISLSTWFKDYVYIPLGGNRVNKPRHYANLMVTFLASGLWHGANWTFVVWGGIHGFAQIVEDMLFGRAKKQNNRFLKLVQGMAVFVFCSFAWIFFVSNSLEDAVYVIRHCIVGGGIQQINVYLRDGILALGIGKFKLAAIGLYIFLLMLYDAISLKIDFVEWMSKKNKILEWMFYISIGLMIVFLSKKEVAAEFIYFQF